MNYQADCRGRWLRGEKLEENPWNDFKEIFLNFDYILMKYFRRLKFEFEGLGCVIKCLKIVDSFGEKNIMIAVN